MQHSTAGEQASVFGSFFGQGSQCIAVSMPGTQQTRSVADSAETIDVSRSAPGAQCMRMQCEGEECGLRSSAWVKLQPPLAL